MQKILPNKRLAVFPESLSSHWEIQGLTILAYVIEVIQRED